ncbi:MAG: NifU family protein [Deltaproteobacteria bacterium]|nr:NifU family protein [Deltaproteobacteria bacterium]
MSEQESTRQQIEDFLHQMIRPQLQMDGGDLEFVDYLEDSKEVQVRLKGACAGCAGAVMTLQFGIERALKNKFGDKVERVVPA